MKRPIFYFSSFKAWDIVTIVVYLILSSFLFWVIDGDFHSELSERLTLFYSMLTQMFLLGFNYRSLRNFSVYILWFLLGLGHMYLYLFVNNDLYLLRSTLVVLATYQMVRVLNLNIQDQEFIMPNRRGGSDVFGERSANFLDYLSALILMGVLFLSVFFWH